MRVLGEGVAIEACIEDVSCASPRAGRHSHARNALLGPSCVRRVCPRVCAFPFVRKEKSSKNQHRTTSNLPEPGHFAKIQSVRWVQSPVASAVLVRPTRHGSPHTPTVQYVAAHSDSLLGGNHVIP